MSLSFSLNIFGQLSPRLHQQQRREAFQAERDSSDLDKEVKQRERERQLKFCSTPNPQSHKKLPGELPELEDWTTSRRDSPKSTSFSPNIISGTCQGLAQVLIEIELPIDEEKYVAWFKVELKDTVMHMVSSLLTANVLQLKDIFEGSITCVFRRLGELLRQRAMGAKVIGNKELQEMFEKTSEMLEHLNWIQLCWRELVDADKQESPVVRFRIPAQAKWEVGVQTCYEHWH
ncbi:hypothetical protein BT96DRAFT_944308 [Gymnopus androsaceus JB14]|uniref:ATP-dependent RNA helicase Ski2/MTR4 C-terminal domain-containing protein n=1 Tax=Gymnopus androsaceus JB14 TaxID=1447944 RepID=A0A6A4H490_9AGAR|nr:hypothetical protein BT96DRAFT_944308 [Gymnopus androsaceus JB14]